MNGWEIDEIMNKNCCEVSSLLYVRGMGNFVSWVWLKSRVVIEDIDDDEIEEINMVSGEGWNS